MSHAERGAAYSGDGRHGSDLGLYATLRLPGWKEAAVFPVLAVVGCVLWFAASPGVTAALFGVCMGPWSPDLPFVSAASVACGAVALAGGFIFPEGFYLWGAALVLHSPFTQGLSVYVMEREGVGLVGGTRGLVGFAMITAVLIVFAAFCYTVLSAIGVGARLLIGHRAYR
jgi:hypothetical protein